MKKITIVLSLLFLLTLSSAKNKTSEGIQFQDANLEDAIKMAKKENKLLFVDLSTSW